MKSDIYENESKLYREFLLDGVKGYLQKDSSAIFSNMHIALNYALQKEISEDTFDKLLSKHIAWLSDLEEMGEVPNE